MENELKITEKMALVRNAAIEAVIPEDAVQVDTGVFMYRNEFGLAKLTVAAVKDQEFDVEKAHAEYLAKLADRAAKAEAKKAAKA